MSSVQWPGAGVVAEADPGEELRHAHRYLLLHRHLLVGYGGAGDHHCSALLILSLLIVGGKIDAENLFITCKLG